MAHYSNEFKKNALELINQEGQSIRQTAKELDVSENTLHRWKRKYNQNGDEAFSDAGQSKDEKIKQQRKEIKKLRRERRILKKAVAYVSPENP
jgi:transposase